MFYRTKNIHSDMALITLFGIMLLLSIGTIVGAPIKRQSSDDSRLQDLLGGVSLLENVVTTLKVSAHVN